MDRRSFVKNTGLSVLAACVITTNALAGRDTCVCPHCGYDFQISKDEIKEIYRTPKWPDMVVISTSINEKGQKVTKFAPDPAVFTGWGTMCPKCGDWHRYSNKDMTGVVSS